MKQKKSNKFSIVKAIKLFAVSIGVTSLTMLTSSGFLDYSNENPWLNVKEASLFNENNSYTSTSINTSKNSIDDKTYVIPLGTSFGIKIFTDGVIVSSLSEVQTGNQMLCPARDAGIKPGDYILSVNGETVTNNASLAQLIGKSGGNPIDLTVRREDGTFDTTVYPVFSDNSFKTGMWIRDSAAGIGTLTFYNPQSKVFAGLGHGICDMDTNGIMELAHGEPAAIELAGITKGKINKPGQLRGYFSSDEALGELLANNETGVYGTFFEPPKGELLEVAKKEEVKTGDVEIIASIDNQGPQKYKAEIKKIQSLEQNTKNLIVKITDSRLLSTTGGIVQGMSGCPILQNGKLVGAITHVFTEDPTTGYGILAATMVKESVVFSMSK